MSSSDIVFLFDVDNTLLDNDRVTEDLADYLDQEVGHERQQRYWIIFEQLRAKLGYADYLGALQQYRIEYPHDPHLLTVSRFMIHYPFADRLYPQALAVVEGLTHVPGVARRFEASTQITQDVEGTPYAQPAQDSLTGSF